MSRKRGCFSQIVQLLDIMRVCAKVCLCPYKGKFYSVFKVQFSKPSIFRWGFCFAADPLFLVGGLPMIWIIYR